MLSFFASLCSKDSTKTDSSESSWNSHCITHLPFNPSVILPLTRELQQSHERNHTRPTVRSHEAEEFMKIDFLSEFILHETGNFKQHFQVLNESMFFSSSTANLMSKLPATNNFVEAILPTVVVFMCLRSSQISASDSIRKLTGLEM